MEFNMILFLLIHPACGGHDLLHRGIRYLHPTLDCEVMLNKTFVGFRLLS